MNTTRTDAGHGDEHMGAVEGDQAGDPQKGNQNADGIDADGLPTDPLAIAEDVLGANADGTEG